MLLTENTHLTYCTNIHSGESWNEVFNQLKNYLPEIKNNLSPQSPFGIGLRISGLASKELLTGRHLDEFLNWLFEKEMYVFTMNGFPYGNFHTTRVKDQVHQPDWTSTTRLNYTLELFQILSGLLPEGMDGGISTSPLSYKPWHSEEEKNTVFRLSTQHILQVTEALYKIKMNTGKELHLDIEPEPDGLLENSVDTLSYYSDWLLPLGIDYFKNNLGISSTEAEKIIKDHIQVCYDVCHFAVMYEEPENVLRQFEEAGIRIGKIQISAALKAQLGDNHKEREHKKELFSQLNEPVYLHQVVEKDNKNQLKQYRDLHEALKFIDKPEAKEWRTHFHVPVFMAAYETLESTQEDIIKVLDILKKKKYTNHLEVETYTWEVLPDNLKLDISASIQRELKWVLNQL